MNEVTEAYDALKKEKQSHSAQKRQHAPGKLVRAGLNFTTHNGGAHLIVEGHTEEIDFWPGTGYWKTRDSHIVGFGVTSLIEQAQR